MCVCGVFSLLVTVCVCKILCCVGVFACMHACVCASGRLLMLQAGLVVSFSLSLLMNDLPQCARTLSLP